MTVARKAGATSAEPLEVADREGYGCAQFAHLLAEDEGCGTAHGRQVVPARRPQPGGTGVNRLDVDGWGVAQVELERSWLGRELADKCWLSARRLPGRW